MNALLLKVGNVELAKKVLHGVPTFIKEAIDQKETFYNPRTEQYVERGVSSALIQLDFGEEYFRTTMPYHSSFYDECVNLNELEEALKAEEAI